MTLLIADRASSYLDSSLLLTMATRNSQFRAITWASQFLSYKRPSWKCASCKNGRPTSILRRSFATAPEDAYKKPYYVTTPIFYVNAGMFCY